VPSLPPHALRAPARLAPLAERARRASTAAQTGSLAGVPGSTRARCPCDALTRRRGRLRARGRAARPRLRRGRQQRLRARPRRRGHSRRASHTSTELRHVQVRAALRACTPRNCRDARDRIERRGPRSPRASWTPRPAAVEERMRVPTDAGRPPRPCGRVAWRSPTSSPRGTAHADRMGVLRARSIARAARGRPCRRSNWLASIPGRGVRPLGRGDDRSDVRAAAIAEARFGAAVASAELLYVTVSTGICTLVLGGRAYAGARGNAICTGGHASSCPRAAWRWPRREGVSAAGDVLADPRARRHRGSPPLRSAPASPTGPMRSTRVVP